MTKDSYNADSFGIAVKRLQPFTIKVRYIRSIELCIQCDYSIWWISQLIISIFTMRFRSSRETASEDVILNGTMIPTVSQNTFQFNDVNQKRCIRMWKIKFEAEYFMVIQVFIPLAALFEFKPEKAKNSH